MSGIFVQDFIASLNDTELKFLYQYKYGSYLESSQALVDAELAARNLDKNEIRGFVRSFKAESGCPTCSSHKRLSNTKICAVCGYDPNTPIGGEKDYNLIEFIGEILEGFSH